MRTSKCDAILEVGKRFRLFILWNKALCWKKRLVWRIPFEGEEPWMLKSHKIMTTAAEVSPPRGLSRSTAVVNKFLFFSGDSLQNCRTKNKARSNLKKWPFLFFFFFCIFVWRRKCWNEGIVCVCGPPPPTRDPSLKSGHLSVVCGNSPFCLCAWVFVQHSCVSHVLLVLSCRRFHPPPPQCGEKGESCCDTTCQPSLRMCVCSRVSQLGGGGGF